MMQSESAVIFKAKHKHWRGVCGINVNNGALVLEFIRFLMGKMDLIKSAKANALISIGP